MKENTELYWIGCRYMERVGHGYQWAFPFTRIPAALDAMQRACVDIQVKGTLWQLPGGMCDENYSGKAESNYDYLVGFQTAGAQQKALKTLLSASAITATNEFKRMVSDEIVIKGHNPSKIEVQA